jgi:UDP-glucose 4-epimerase
MAKKISNRAKKFLIAGGAGFIGSHIANKLISLGHKVVILDNLSTGKRENINSAAKFYLADIRDEKLVKKIFKKERPEVVINEAAKVYWSEKEKSSILDISTSVSGTINLLESCVRYGVKKFIFASTISVYGRLPDRTLVKETAEISRENMPVSIFSYAIAKHAAEQYIYYFNKKYGLAYAILRYAHVYGPGQFGQKDTISIFIENFANNKPLLVTGSGKQFRDYVYIKDVVGATILAVNGKNNGIFNIGGGAPITVNDLIKIFGKIFKKNIKIKNIEPEEQPDGMCMNILKARKDLKWFPRFSIEMGLEKTVLDWLKKAN